MPIPTYGEIVHTLGMNREDLLDFFVLFSRMEYALKSCGYVSNLNGASPDWDKFANQYSKQFESDLILEELVDLAKAHGYLFAEPPRKQCLGENNILEWKRDEQWNSQGLKETLLLIRRIRNNLFHGGKYEGYVPVRDNTLICHATTILRRCLEYSHDVLERYCTL